jgi:hypothetical protein
MMLTGDSEVQRDFTLLSNINPTWTDLELNPGLHSQRQAISHLSHCTAPSVCYEEYMKNIYPY